MISPWYLHSLPILPGYPRAWWPWSWNPGTAYWSSMGSQVGPAFFAAFFSMRIQIDGSWIYIYIYIYILYLLGGLEHVFSCFSIYWECHHPNWRAYFSEGLKPPTRYIIIYIQLNTLYIYIYVVMFIILIGKSSINWVMLTTWKESRIFKGNHPKRSQLWSERCMIFGLVPSIS